MAVQIRLRELRKAKGLTQVQLAEQCGMPQSTISRIESGTTSGVDFDTLDRVAAALGVHPSELIGWDKVPFEYAGCSYILSDASADGDLPAGAGAQWRIEGTSVVFPVPPGTTPHALVGLARERLRDAAS